MNILLVSHCDFRGNSAFHVLAIAKELHARGYAPAIAVPDDPRTIEDLVRPPFPVVGFADVERLPEPDLVHAFTPREHVRRLTEEVGRPYVVHLEDNEDAVLADAVGAEAYAALQSLPLEDGDAVVGPRRAHPLRAAAFLEGAAGVTAVIETLLEGVPDGVPRAVCWPGFDPAALELPQPSRPLRARLRLRRGDFVLVYTGNVHESNLAEVQELYRAVAALRARGERVVLVKTGWNHVDMGWVRDVGARRFVRDLGFVPRWRVWDVLALADAFVQPGAPGPFNDYRFPSKLPDYLVSGKPVVLPATNLGLYLRTGVDALVLTRGDVSETVAAARRLIADPGLRRRLGEAGRAFALRHLRWDMNVERVLEIYSAAGASCRRST